MRKFEFFESKTAIIKKKSKIGQASSKFLRTLGPFLRTLVKFDFFVLGALDRIGAELDRKRTRPEYSRIIKNHLVKQNTRVRDIHSRTSKR